MEHTALNWEVTSMSPWHKGEKGMICVRAVNSPINAILATIGTDKEAEANAEFIVRACENHYKLVEALTTISEMTARLSKRKYSPKHDYPMEYKFNDIAHLCNQAISNATRKEV